eukprot:gene22540-biopygen1182
MAGPLYPSSSPAIPRVCFLRNSGANGARSQQHPSEHGERKGEEVAGGNDGNRWGDPGVGWEPWVQGGPSRARPSLRVLARATLSRRPQQNGPSGQTGLLDKPIYRCGAAPREPTQREKRQRTRPRHNRFLAFYRAERVRDGPAAAPVGGRGSLIGELAPGAERRSGTSTCTTPFFNGFCGFFRLRLAQIFGCSRESLGRRTLIWHASREFAPRCEPHPARAKWNPMIRMGSGSSLAVQRLSRAPLQFILSVGGRLAVTRFPVVPSG